MGKNDRNERPPSEREEIEARVAQFKATQQRFLREREEYAILTWRRASARPPR
jgi:hypothetical protein